MVVQAIAVAHQQVVLGGQVDETQAELARRRFHAEAGVGHAGGHIGGHGGVGELFLIGIVDGGRINALLFQHQIEQGAGAGVPVPVDKAHGWIGQVRQPTEARFSTGAHHQALLAGHEANHPQVVQIEPVLVERHDPFRQPGAGRQVEAGQVRFAPRQDVERMGRVGVLQIQLHPVGEFRQQRHRVAVAGVQPQHRVLAGQQLLQLGVELRGQTVELGAQPRLYPLLGPQQLFTQNRQPGALPFAHLHQGQAKEIGGAVKQVPGVAVGNTRGLGGLGELAGVMDAIEQAENHRLEQFPLIGVEHPGGGDMELLLRHCSSYLLGGFGVLISRVTLRQRKKFRIGYSYVYAQ